MPSTTRRDLLSAALGFCNTFADQKPPEEIFSHFSASDDVLALEHGLPQLAAFLGREFRGQTGLKEYFQLLSSNLKYENMRFSNFVVDPDVLKVSCRGEARFTWTSTGQSWDEVFTYALEFDKDNKVKVYEIWADSGAAYLASKGQLKQ
ncbi:transcription elongation factor S-II [Exophiala viscosa]|uniref:transcription elongation factor S-II n=1 Tax=Exophiala viscosa TaxID=2486360 RepID=UPI0021953914|nr:transcription elongation factor S-II [Exophiala viscosa]